MIEQFLRNEFIVLACVVAGWVVGRWAYRKVINRRTAHSEAPEDGDWHVPDAVAFVGGAFGIILGLLLVFAVQHFTDAKDASRQEAVAEVALFQASGPYPQEERDVFRHSVVCLMESTASDDWQAGAAGDLTGSENTNAWMIKMQQLAGDLTIDSEVQTATYYSLTEQIVEASKYRQLRLMYALPDIPLAIWIVIYICTFAFITLLVVHLGDRRRTAAISVAACGLVLIAIVGTLTILDFPYSGFGASLRPTALDASLIQLEDAYPGAIWEPCEELAASTPG